MNEIPPLPSACGGPSLHLLRRLETGELSTAEELRVRTHAVACPRCQAALQDFAAERAAARIAVPFSGLEARLDGKPRGRRASWRRLLLALFLPATAVAVFVLAPRPTPVKDGADSPIRTKGGQALDYFVQTADGSRLVAEGDASAVKPGDALRFRYSADHAPYVLIVGVDADGHVYPYLAEGDRSARASLVPQALAPSAVQLDADPRPERVFALFSKEPIAVDEVKPVAKDALQAVGGSIEKLESLPMQAAQRTVLLKKASR